jgi:hypothetical protein
MPGIACTALVTRKTRHAALLSVCFAVAFTAGNGISRAESPISDRPYPKAKDVAPPDVKKVPSNTGRIVHFPNDRSLGQLRIQDAGAVRQLNYWFHWTDTGEPQTEYLCEAQGDVQVPARKRLFLAVSKTGLPDVSWLSNLKPDDLYGLTLQALPTDRVRPSDGYMEHIARLTGLKSLALGISSVTDADVQRITNLASLEYLHLPDQIGDTGLAYVAELPSLKGLYIECANSRLTDAGLRLLAKTKSLEELYLRGERMGDAGLVYLRDLPRLKYLALYGSHFTDAGMVYVKDIASLRILSFHENLCRITDAGLVHISQMPRLESLCLHGMQNITDNGLAHLTKMRSLKKLDIGSSQVTDRGLAILSQIKTLERLDLPQDQKGITDKGLTNIAELPNLKHLEVSRIHFIDPNMNKEYYTDKGLAELTRCRLLEDLGIGSIGITDAGMDHIARLTNLKHLALFGCDNVTDKGLVKLAGLKSLTDLNVFHADVTIVGLNQLNSLSNLARLDVHDLRRGGAVLNLSGLTSLESLMLGFARKSAEAFTDTDLMCLSNLRRLTDVQIGPCDFTDKGMAHLAGLTNLERLNVGGSRLTDDGLKYLANTRKLDLLHISSGWGTSESGRGGKFTDVGLRYLEGLKLLSHLEITSDTAFSAAAIQHLREELPNLYSLSVNGRNILPSSSPMPPKTPTTRPSQSSIPARQRSDSPNRRR